MSSTSSPSKAVPRHRRVPAAVLMLLVGVAALAAVVGSLEREPEELPAPVLTSPERPVSMQRCRDCHEEQFDAFKDAPHMQTLRPANADVFLEMFADRRLRLREGGPEYHFFHRDGDLWVKCEAFPEPVRIDWMFGSGQHDVTPVSLLTDPQGRTELVEHAVSWFSGSGLGPTLGSPESHKSGHGFQAIGAVSTHDSALHCFGCHVTHLPLEEGRLIESGMISGVQCTRCHVRAREHITAMETGSDATFLDDWKQLTPLESINRCGECHRRADQMTPEELTPENHLLLRFAPVGISQSPCFLEQEHVRDASGTRVRMDCTFCHDPHRPAVRDVRFYVQKCLECHGSDPHQAAVCGARPMTSDCLKCHMPKVPVQPPLDLEFTDHWIRIRAEE